EPRAAKEVKPKNCPVPVVEKRVSRRKDNELLCASQGERLRFLDRVTTGTRDELAVGWVGHDDRQPEFGGSCPQVLVKARERRHASVDGLRCRVSCNQPVGVSLHPLD